MVLAMERFVLLLGIHPKMMEQDGELTGHRGLGFSPRDRASATRQTQPETAKVAVWAEWSHDIVGRTHQQPSNLGVPCLGDRQRLIDLPGLIATGNKSQIRTHTPAALESLWSIKSKNERQRRDRAHSLDGAQPFGLRVSFVT